MAFCLESRTSINSFEEMLNFLLIGDNECLEHWILREEKMRSDQQQEEFVEIMRRLRDLIFSSWYFEMKTEVR